MATFWLHHQTLITIKYQSTRQEESNEPKLDGVASFNYGVPMATFWLHHQTLITIKYQSTRQEESNEPKLDGAKSPHSTEPLPRRVELMDPTPVGVVLRRDASKNRPWSMSRAVGTPVRCPAAFGEAVTTFQLTALPTRHFFRGTFSVGFSLIIRARPCAL
ncbi:hypothetical protein EVAR_57461_1 [Eumeta japonica]|uniref:Uncharacterized protein n=1 Tax=Eumeta variegata TaxID=151549 RepID=A0A4C1ZHH0_EUMVA|nr:hypothetical protein EVAR_57461_1 [Eumeta japonica]